LNGTSLAFLPDGRLLVTERTGRLRMVGTDGTLSEPLSGMPSNMYAAGGLYNAAPDRNFAGNRTCGTERRSL
jgi:glucose/arabinose dehydrogenase